MGNIGQNGYWHCRHISRVYVLFCTAGFSTKLPGSHRSRIPDSWHTSGSAIFRSAAVGSELGHADRFAKFSRTKKDWAELTVGSGPAALSRSTLRRVTRDIMWHMTLYDIWHYMTHDMTKIVLVNSAFFWRLFLTCLSSKQHSLTLVTVCNMINWFVTRHTSAQHFPFLAAGLMAFVYIV